MAARRRGAGQSPYLTPNSATTQHSTSSVSLQDFARSALSLGETSTNTTSSPQAQAAQASRNPSSSNSPAAQPKKRRKKAKPSPAPSVDPSIRNAVANVGMPVNSSSAGGSARPSRSAAAAARQRQPQRPEPQGYSSAAQSSPPRTTSTEQVTSGDSPDVQQFRQRHGVWEGIVPDEEPPPAFVASRPPSPEPSSPPPTYLQIAGPTQNPTPLEAPVDATAAAASSMDDWPPLFLLPSWLDVEHLPAWQESTQDQELLGAWRRDELSGLPVEERARRHHLRRKRRDRLERRNQRLATAQIQQTAPHLDPQSSLSDFMKATNDFIASHFPQSDQQQQPQSQPQQQHSQPPSREDTSDSSESEPAPSPPVRRLSPRRKQDVFALATPALPAVTVWDTLEAVPEEEPEREVLPSPSSVTVWGDRNSSSNNNNNTKRQSHIAGEASPPPRSSESAASSDLEDRRMAARRHSALLVRPLSIKRKPPPVPAPRRWARAVERASSISSPSGDDEQQEIDRSSSSSRPLSGSFSPRIQALREQFEGRPRQPPPVPEPRRSRLNERPTSISSSLQSPPPEIIPETDLSRQAPSEELLQPSYRDQFERITLTDGPTRPSMPPRSSSVSAEPLQSQAISTLEPEDVVPEPSSLVETERQMIETSQTPLHAEEEPANASASTIPTSTSAESVPEAESAGGSEHQQPRRQQSAQYTELDVLASRINDQRVSSGEAYDDIVLLSEVLGPHQPTPRAASGTQQKDMEEEVWDQIPVLMVEESRRRVDPKTGKTRIKLSCGGVNVNKCLVCLTQFKATEMCAIFPVCTHCFHENCLRSWLRRSPRASCPNCRQDLPIS